jgi:DNA repair exonuclease SbcCD ATPase subunit
MILGKAKATNFQSYPSIEFDYANLGLALVSGVTGSGKSTLLDVPAWTLFGITSKDSAADDVRAWDAGAEQTTGEIHVSTPEGGLTVYRVRAKGSHQNDFYWIEDSAPDVKRRGKDAPDTLRLLEQRLGVTAELYLAGAYMHQFSTAEQFFVAKAKDRREALEKIADLSLPVRIAERASETRKTAKKNLEAATTAQARVEAKLEQLQTSLTDNASDIADWFDERDAKVEALEKSSASFETEKQARLKKIREGADALAKQTRPAKDFDTQADQIRRDLKKLEASKAELKTAQKRLAEITADIRSKKAEYDRFTDDPGETCPTCLGSAQNDNRAAHLAKLEAEIVELVEAQVGAEAPIEELENAVRAEPKLTRALQDVAAKRAENQRLIDRRAAELEKAEVVERQENTFDDQVRRMKADINPFEARVAQIEAAIAKAKSDIKAGAKAVKDLEHRVASLTTLYDKSFELRGKLIEQAVRELNDSTNEYLEKYFEASLRVQFSVKDGDKIDVVVLNNGFECPYKQLSGGERTLLKLCFNLPFMRMAENRAGIKFGCLMFDEPLKGLSDGLKDRAFVLLQAMETDYQSILLIEHYEPFRSMFGREFHVENLGGHSVVEEVIAA